MRLRVQDDLGVVRVGAPTAGELALLLLPYLDAAELEEVLRRCPKVLAAVRADERRRAERAAWEAARLAVEPVPAGEVDYAWNEFYGECGGEG